VIFVTENNHLVVKAKRRESSLARYYIRAKRDACLHNDFEDFLSKHDTSLTRLVDMLLDNAFTKGRHTDPTYPLGK